MSVYIQLIENLKWFAIFMFHNNNLQFYKL